MIDVYLGECFNKLYVMKKLVFIVSMLFAFQTNVSSQESLNDYKYIVVPNQFDFLKGKDKYKVNSLTKFLFNKYGFVAYFEDEDFPQDLRNNKCLGLVADVNKAKGGFLKTKLQITLTNCDNKVIEKSRVGESKVKEYDKAYNLALRDAFVSFQYLDYKYKPNETILARSISNNVILNEVNKEEASKAKEEIVRLQEEIKTLKETKDKQVEAVEIPEVKEVIEVPIVKEEVIGIVEESKQETKEKVLETLYAQPIDKGFQVVDSTPKVVMTLLETTKANTFIVKDKNAIVYKEDGFWYLSKNDGNTVTTERLNINF